MLTLSKHIQKRMTERNISQPDIEMMLFHGKEVRFKGLTAWYMPKSTKEIPASLQKLILIATQEDHAITAYWSNKSTLRTIKKFIKY